MNETPETSVHPTRERGARAKRNDEEKFINTLQSASKMFESERLVSGAREREGSHFTKTPPDNFLNGWSFLVPANGKVNE